MKNLRPRRTTLPFLRLVTTEFITKSVGEKRFSRKKKNSVNELLTESRATLAEISFEQIRIALQLCCQI